MRNVLIFLLLVIPVTVVSAQSGENTPIPIATARPTALPTATRTALPTATLTPAAGPTLATPLPVSTSAGGPGFNPNVRTYGWTLPGELALNSPTAYMTSTADPSGGPGQIGNATAHAFATNGANIVATLDGFATSQALSLPGSGPIDVAATYTDLTDNWLVILLAYLKGVDADDWGNLAPLFLFTIVAFVLVATVKLFLLLIPVIAALIGFFRRIVEFFARLIELFPGLQ